MTPSLEAASPSVTVSLFAASAAETEAYGEALGRRLTPGTIVLLYGDLGAGKTTFAHGVGRGLEVAAPLQSPTFALIYEYASRLPLAHMDFYRLNSAEELDGLGLDEYLEGNGVVLIEWPEIAEATLPRDRIEVRLRDEGDGRRLELTARGSAALLLKEGFTL